MSPEPPASTVELTLRTSRCSTVGARRAGPAHRAAPPRVEVGRERVLRTDASAARSAGGEPADELLLPRRLKRARPPRRPDGRDRGRRRGADVDQRAGADHSAPTEPTHASHDDRLASLEPVATPTD